MRDYVSLPNLYKAAGLAALVTVMSIGRLIQADVWLGMYVPMTFMSMLFVGGAVTAWGRSAGMAGIATDRATLGQGIGVAAFLVLVALPIYVLWLDPMLQRALLETGRSDLLEMSYPSTTRGRLAMLLWSAGFQALFFVAAPMSYFARLTRSVWLSIAFCLAVRGFLVFRQMVESGIVDGAPYFVSSALASTFLACLVFARYGLIPTMLFAAGLDLRAFF
jgi:hypothetical protein